jgi:hypothetical protein
MLSTLLLCHWNRCLILPRVLVLYHYRRGCVVSLLQESLSLYSGPVQLLTTPDAVSRCALVPLPPFWSVARLLLLTHFCTYLRVASDDHAFIAVLIILPSLTLSAYSSVIMLLTLVADLVSSAAVRVGVELSYVLLDLRVHIAVWPDALSFHL